GFVEQAAACFGLSANDSTLKGMQALVGTRVERDWSPPLGKLGVHAHLEKQRTVAQSGELIEARFTGIDAWAPISGKGLGEQATVLGLGLRAHLPVGRLGLDVDARRESGETWTGAYANWSVGF